MFFEGKVPTFFFLIWGKVPRSNDLGQGKVPTFFIFLEERFLGQRTWTKERFLIFYFFQGKVPRSDDLERGKVPSSESTNIKKHVFFTPFQHSNFPEWYMHVPSIPKS